MSIRKHPRKRQWRVRHLTNDIGEFPELGEAKRFVEVTLTLTKP